MNYPLSAGDVAREVNEAAELHPQEKNFIGNTVNAWRATLPEFLYIQDETWTYQIETPRWIVFGLQLKRHDGFNTPAIKEVFKAAITQWGEEQALGKMEEIYDPCDDFRVYLWKLMFAQVELPNSLKNKAAKPLAAKAHLQDGSK